jgi:flagellar assembly factor FliW
MKYKVVLPILGFESVKEFRLEELDGGFFSLKSKEVTFTLVNPFILRDDYAFEISEEEQKKLNLKEDSNYFVLNIVILNEPFLDSTVNFAAPLIFNSDKKILGQVVLDEYNFGLMEPLKKFVKGNR